MLDVRSAAGFAGPRLVLVAAAVAIFGLLSVHGWGTHAGMHNDASHASHASHASNDVAPLNGAADVPGVEPAQRTHAAAEGATQSRVGGVVCVDGCGGVDPGVGMGLLGLCLAVLGTVMLAFAVLLRRRCIPLLRTMRPAYWYPALPSRDRDPPDLLRICVTRC